MTPKTRELEQLADLFGVVTSYEDVQKKRCKASVESLLAVLRMLGAKVESLEDVPSAIRARQLELAERGIEPVIVVWDGQATDFALSLPVGYGKAEFPCTLQLETGGTSQFVLVDRPAASKSVSANGTPTGFTTVRLQTPAGIEAGYHRLTVETAIGFFETCLISAPTRAYESSAMAWGCFLPLYAMRTDRNWGAGDFTDLADMTVWLRGFGGRLAGTLPLLAAYLDEPFEPSPYSPASRVFWSEFYLDVERIPELEHCAAARELIATDDFQTALADLRTAGEVDYRRIMEMKRRVLEHLVADLIARQSERFVEFNRFAEQNRELRDYAKFRATYERRREPWPSWPDQLREGVDWDESAAAYHCYVQWIVGQQLGELAERAVTAGDGLYLDLPLGVRRDSFDVWRNPHAYVDGATAGAPPDSFFTKGQNWDFPPLHPEGIRRDGYQHVRAYLSHHMRLARTLRIDHVMGLHRLYWIPRHRPASEGVYVRYRADELYAVMCLESQRNKTTIIGENLGTVPKEVNESLRRHGVRRMFVVQYELYPEAKSPLADIPHDCIATLNTHDMPTFAAWWDSLDIPLRQQLGLLNEAEADSERKNLKKTKANLVAWLQSAGWLQRGNDDAWTALAAILKCLAASDADSVMVNLEDLWRETLPQNVPGTGPELPNWKRKAALTLKEFSQHPEVMNMLEAIGQLRQKAETAAKRQSKSKAASPGAARG